MRSRSSSAQVKRRCGPIGTLSGLGGALRAPGQRERADGSDVAEQLLRDAARARARAERTPRAISAGTVARSSSASASSCARAGQRARDPRLFGRRRRRRLRRHVEQDGRDVDAGDPVDERVVGLAEDREAAAFEPLDEPQLPQRLVAVELLREGAAGEVLELLVAAGRRQRVVLHVVPRVEVRIVDPHRAALAERDEREPLAVARHEVQARLDVRDQLVVRRRRPVEHHARGDVHVRRGVVLEVQERAVEPGQAVAIGHAAIVPGTCQVCDRAHSGLARPCTLPWSSTCRVVAARCGGERGNHCRACAIRLAGANRRLLPP